MKNSSMLSAICNLFFKRPVASKINKEVRKDLIRSTVHPFNSLSVRDDIDVMLVESNSNVIRIQGKKEYAELVSLQLKEGELQLSAGGRTVHNEVIAIVPIKNLVRLQVHGASEVFSLGVLQSPELALAVNGPCNVSVRTRGMIVVDKDQSYDSVYSRVFQSEILKKFCQN